METTAGFNVVCFMNFSVIGLLFSINKVQFYLNQSINAIQAFIASVSRTYELSIIFVLRIQALDVKVR